MPVPAVLGLEVDHRELPRHEVDRPAERPQHDLDQAVVDLVHAVDLVVVERDEEAREQLAIDVEAEPDRADRDIAPAEERARRRTASRPAGRGGSRPRRTARWSGAARASARSRRRRRERGAPPAASRAASTDRATQRSGTTDCQRGRIAQTRERRPARSRRSPPSGPPSAGAVADSTRAARAAAAATSPVIATRRCQIAARSIPSNHSSTHGSVLISTRPIDSSRIDSAPEQLAEVAPAWTRPAGRARSQRMRLAHRRGARWSPAPPPGRSSCGARRNGTSSQERSRVEIDGPAIEVECASRTSDSSSRRRGRPSFERWPAGGTRRG